VGVGPRAARCRAGVPDPRRGRHPHRHRGADQPDQARDGRARPPAAQSHRGRQGPRHARRDLEGPADRGRRRGLVRARVRRRRRGVQAARPALRAEPRDPHASLDRGARHAADRRVQPARGGHGAANLPAAAPADPHRRLRRRRAPARRHEGRRLADLFLHARELPEVVGEDRRVRARGRARPDGAHRHQPARDLRRALARGDRGADASLARDRVGRGRLERIDDRARRARQRRRVRRAAARPRPDGRRPDRPHPLSVRAGAGRAGRARHPAAPPR